tara:strand:+ start:1742 stop:2041 length:300 start_codon:yes stop_codon:yes gene_type:complete
MSEDQKNEAALKLLQYFKRTISEEVYQQLKAEFESNLQNSKPKKVSDKMTFPEVMTLFGKTRNTISTWIAKGKLPKPIRYGREWKFNRVEILNLFENGL